MFKLPLKVCAALALSVLNTSLTFGQYTNPNTPIIFSNGTSIDVDSLYPTTSQSSIPELTNQVQISVSGTLTSVSNHDIGFLTPFAGAGTLAVNVGGDFVQIGSTQPSPPPFIISSGLNLESGQVILSSGSTAINGPFSVTGNITLDGNVTLANNSISGTGTLALGGMLTLSGSGPGFISMTSLDPNEPNLDAVASDVVLTNSTGTQTLGGTIGDYVYRVGEGGTSVFTSNLEENVYVEGGTAVLTGPNGAVAYVPSGDAANSSLDLQGGTLILDNTSTNNNNRISTRFLEWNGGNLTLLGINGGATNEYNNFPRGSGQTTGPVFNQGMNVLTVQAGAGTSSYASYTWGGLPTSADGSVDFEGLGANSQVFFNSMGEGPIGPWATLGGTDFAYYDTTNGVEAMPAASRPTQISAGTSGSYVLATSHQNNLTSNVSVYGVTMNASTNLDLGGNTLIVGSWIQNTGSATISDGTLQGPYINEGGGSSFGDLVFTTNASLTVNAVTFNSYILKNGTGTLTLTGSASSGIPKIFLNQGTVNLSEATPMSNGFSYLGVPSVIIGLAAGGPGSAVLSLQANNQFLSSTNNSQEVGVQILQAGQFNFNGYSAVLQYLEVDGGTVNQAGGTLTAGSLTANPLSVAGQITGGIVTLTGTAPTISVTALGPTPYGYQAAADGLIISSQITSSSPLTKSGDGVLVLGNSSNSFGNGTVGLIVTAGTVALQNSGAAGSPNQQIQLANYGGLEAETTGTLTLPNPLTLGPADFSGSPLALVGGVTQSVHGTINVSNTTTINRYINNLSPGSDGLTGTGTLVLSGVASGTTTGTFTVNGGTLGFASSTALPSAMTLLFSAGALEAVNNPEVVTNPLNITNDINFVGTESLTFACTTGNVLSSSSTRAIYTGDTQPVTINNLNALQSTLISGGPGTLILAGNPTNLVGTQITGGTLDLLNANASGVPLGLVTIGSLATLNLNNSNASAISVSGSGAVALGTGTFTVLSGSFSGAISGAGALSMTGSGALTLSGPLSYTGPTTVTSGTLTTSDGLTSTSSISISAGATMSVSGGNLNATGNITNTGTLVLGSGVTVGSGGTVTNNGTLDVRNDPTFTRPTNFVNNGIILISSPSIDTPTMPPWTLVLTAVFLSLIAGRYLANTSASRV